MHTCLCACTPLPPAIPTPYHMHTHTHTHTHTHCISDRPGSQSQVQTVKSWLRALALWKGWYSGGWYVTCTQCPVGCLLPDKGWNRSCTGWDWSAVICLGLSPAVVSCAFEDLVCWCWGCLLCSPCCVMWPHWQQNLVAGHGRRMTFTSWKVNCCWAPQNLFALTPPQLLPWSLQSWRGNRRCSMSPH